MHDGSLTAPGRFRTLLCASANGFEVFDQRAATLGYRLQSGGNTVVYSVDHEPHAPNPASRAEGEPSRHKEDQRHIDFLADADLVIHDSQYTIAEYSEK